MTGEILEVQKESFWKEHQDTLVRLRHDLVSGKGGRSKFSPGTSPKHEPSAVAVSAKTSQHPPYGKYRRTPSPYLPKLSSPANQDHNRPSPKRFEVVPPLKPKRAFFKPAEDYDSWGEESNDEADDRVDDIIERAHNGPQPTRDHARTGKPHKHYKPQHYPHMSTRSAGPLPVYYPAPRKGHNKSRQHKAKKRPDRNRLHQGRHKQQQQTGRHGTSKDRKSRSPHKVDPAGRHGTSKDRKSRSPHKADPAGRHGTSKDRKSRSPHKVDPAGRHGTSKDRKSRSPHKADPISSTQRRMSSAAVVLTPTSETEGEDEHESIKAALLYWQQHPVFAGDFTDWFVQDCLHTELCPDLMVDTFKEMQHMPYDHPLYQPSMNCCEDIVTDHVSEMIMDIARETLTEVAYDYMDEKMLQRDPVEDFLASLVEDVVIMDTREIIRSVVVELAEEYLQTQYSTGIVHMLVDDYTGEIGAEMLEEVLFDLAAEEFIRSEVIAPEVLEEAEELAHETVQYLDTKVMRREFKEVRRLADNKLADVVMSELVLSMMQRQGDLSTEEEHLSRYLDGMIFSESISQMISLNKERDRTLYCKPLHKLHEKAVSDVALDVFLQQLTWSLDEDLADVDEYETWVAEEAVYPFSMIVR